MQSKFKEIRELAINAVINKSLTPQKAAKIAGVSLSTIYSWAAIYKKTESYEARAFPINLATFIFIHFSIKKF